MLILTRKAGQSICLGEDINVTVMEVSGDKVRIGIEAPRSVRVLREELVGTLDSNRQAAAGVDTAALRAAASLLGMTQKTPAQTGGGKQESETTKEPG